MKFLILLFITSINLHASDTIRFEKITDIKADKICADQSDNLYILSGNILQKFNSINDQFLEFSTESGEIITDMNCQNPHKLILYFDDQNKCTFLDNKLNKIGEDILFEQIGISGEALVSSAYNGGYLIYDKTYGILYKTGPSFNIEYQKYIDFEVEPIKILNNQNSLIFISETDELITYTNDLNFKRSILEKHRKISVNITKGCYSYFDKENKLIIVKSLNYPHQILSEFHIQENIEITYVIIGNKKVFAITESEVYIGDLALMKE